MSWLLKKYTSDTFKDPAETRGTQESDFNRCS